MGEVAYGVALGVAVQQFLLGGLVGSIVLGGRSGIDHLAT